MSDGERLMAFLYARSRNREAVARGARPEVANLQFAEWFIAKGEGDTGSYTKEPVAARLGALRLEWGRK